MEVAEERQPGNEGRESWVAQGPQGNLLQVQGTQPSWEGGGVLANPWGIESWGAEAALENQSATRSWGARENQRAESWEVRGSQGNSLGNSAAEEEDKIN